MHIIINRKIDKFSFCLVFIKKRKKKSDILVVGTKDRLACTNLMIPLYISCDIYKINTQRMCMRIKCYCFFLFCLSYLHSILNFMTFIKMSNYKVFFFIQLIQYNMFVFFLQIWVIIYMFSFSKSLCQFRDFFTVCQIHPAHSNSSGLCVYGELTCCVGLYTVFYFPQTVAITINRCAISATRCNKSGAMRAKFSLAKSHDGKICTTYAACSLPGAGIFTMPAACFCCK